MLLFFTQIKVGGGGFIPYDLPIELGKGSVIHAPSPNCQVQKVRPLALYFWCKGGFKKKVQCNSIKKLFTISDFFAKFVYTTLKLKK